MPDDVVFDYDATTKKLSNSGLDIYANGSSTEIYYLGVYTDPEIFHFVETAATPQPVDANTFYGMNYYRNYDYGYLDFDIPYFDVDGNYMNTDKLYYKVYVGDDEDNTVFTFTPEEYKDLTEPMTEVPFSFKATDFWCSDVMHEFATYVNQAKNLGVQIVYKGGGEEHASEIVWNYDNNGSVGYESVFPLVENPQVNSTLADGETALNLGVADYAFSSGRAATETFDVAMKVMDDWNSGAKLTGKKVVGVSIPFITITGISNAKAWLSTSIDLNADGTFTPNGPVKSFTLADNGIKADGTLTISSGTISATSTGSQYKYSSSVTASPKAIKSTGALTISGGTVYAKSGSHEGMESKSTISISGGYIYVEASDDAINSAGVFTITGGYVFANSSGNDGLDANGNMTISGGNIVAVSASGAEVGIDVIENGTLTINGGNIIAIGGLENTNNVSGTCYQASSYSKGS